MLDAGQEVDTGVSQGSSKRQMKEFQRYRCRIDSMQQERGDSSPTVRYASDAMFLFRSFCGG